MAMKECVEANPEYYGPMAELEEEQNSEENEGSSEMGEVPSEGNEASSEASEEASEAKEESTATNEVPPENPSPNETSPVNENAE